MGTTSVSFFVLCDVFLELGCVCSTLGVVVIAAAAAVV